MNGDTEGIKSKLNDYYEAFNNKNWEKFSDLFDGDFIYYPNNSTKMNKSQFVDFIKNKLWDGRTFKIEELMINFSNDNTLAIAVYRISLSGLREHEETEVIAIESVTFKRLGNEWKVIHCRVSDKY